MALMSSGLYDALRAAGAPEDKARNAAEEVAASNKDHLDMRGEFESLRGEFNVVKWMLGTVIAMQIGTFGAVFAFAINHVTLR